jgi:HlyD family secretion protein
MPENNNIELRSEEVQEILGHIPSRIIRYGITIFFAVIATVFVASFFFKYPDILTAPAEVVTQNPPAPMVAKASGNLTHLFVADSQWVEPGTILAVIKNPAQWEDVRQLQNILEMLKNQDWDNNNISKTLKNNLDLGTLQQTYAALVKSLNDYNTFKLLNSNGKKISALQKKQQELTVYENIVGRQAELKAQDHQLAKNAFYRDSQLYKQQVIALAEYENARKTLIQSGLSVESAKSTVVNTRMQQQDISQQIADLELNTQQSISQYHLQLNEILSNLNSQLQQWENQYVLQTPISGIVAFNKVWSSNQFVQSGNTVMTIIPSGKSQMIGRVSLPVVGAGKVKPGQRVNIKFNNFPHQEFGMITASVASIALVPAEEAYMVELNMPDSLITNYGKQLPFSQNMPATAEIVTEDLPLIARLFNPLKAILKKHTAGNEKVKMSNIEDRIKNNENLMSKIEVGTKKDSPTIKQPVTNTSQPKTQNTQHNPTPNTQHPATKKNAPTHQLTYSPTSNLQPATYHIIAASYTSKEKAKKGISIFKNKGFSPQLIEKNGKIRLSIFSDSNKSACKKKLRELKENAGYKDCWLVKY